MYRTFQKLHWLIALLMLVSSCAHHGQEHLFDKRSEIEVVKKQFPPPPPGLASVYLIREKMFLQEVAWVPQPQAGFIVNDRVVAVAPRGSFVQLLFEPGKQKIGVMTVLSDKRLSDAKISDVIAIDVSPDQTYFVNAQFSFPSGLKLNTLGREEGENLVSESKMAKTIHVPISLAAFEKQRQDIADAKTRKQVEEARQRAAQELELSQTAGVISDFFAAAAAVAVVALFVVGFGIAVSAIQPSNVPSMPVYADISPPAYVSNANSVRSGSGKTMPLEIKRNAHSASVLNLSTGVRYNLDGDRYVGSDGSWYKVSGNTIYTNTGSYYTRAGNFLTSNDGRQCALIGTLIKCN